MRKVRFILTHDPFLLIPASFVLSPAFYKGHCTCKSDAVDLC